MKLSPKEHLFELRIERASVIILKDERRACEILPRYPRDENDMFTVEKEILELN
jgi:hypothetical protein